MPRYTLSQTYASPRPLTEAEQRTLAAAVEVAALDYLYTITAPAWEPVTTPAGVIVSGQTLLVRLAGVGTEPPAA